MDSPVNDDKLKLTMFQTTSKLTSLSLEDVMGCFHSYFNTERVVDGDAFIERFVVRGPVKLLCSGKLNNSLCDWDTTSLPEETNYKEVKHNTGSIHVKVKTYPGDINLSLLYFFKGKTLKISGGLPHIDVIKFYGLKAKNLDLLDLKFDDLSADDVQEQTKIIDTGIECYINSINKVCSCLFDTMPRCSTINMLNAQYDIGHNISSLNTFPAFASDTKLFSKVMEPNAEIFGRRNAVKLYVEHNNGKYYSCAFDEKGKVQIFSCINYGQVYDMMHKVDNVLEMARLCEVLTFIERDTYTRPKRKYNKKNR